MIVNCDDEIVIIMGDGFRVVIDEKEAKQMAQKILNYYDDDDCIDD